jgi:hypothetical protein
MKVNNDFMKKYEDFNAYFSEEDGNQANFLKAISSQDLDAGLFFLLKGDVDPSLYGNYYLQILSDFNEIETIKYVLTLKNKYPDIDINSRNQYAFKQSCRYGYLELTKFLTKTIECVKIDTLTASLILASKQGYFKTVEYLIDTHKVSALSRNNSAFLCAYDNKFVKTCAVLFSHVDVRNSLKESNPDVFEEFNKIQVSTKIKGF